MEGRPVVRFELNPRVKRKCFVRERFQICVVVIQFRLALFGVFCPGWICGYLDFMMRSRVRPPHLVVVSSYT